MESNNKVKEPEIENALAYAESIINTVHDPLIILDEDLRIEARLKEALSKKR